VGDDAPWRKGLSGPGELDVGKHREEEGES
jgi:hypothetical protein